MKSKKPILIIIGSLAIIAVIIVINYFLTRVPNNPDDATGNSAGNLISGGLFCEKDGKIYFSNTYDNGKLYSMNPDCTNIQKLSNDEVSFINCYGDYLYYVNHNGTVIDWISVVLTDETHSIVRSKLNGSQTTVLATEHIATDLSLSGNTLVFNTMNTLTHSITTKGEDEKVILKEDNVNASVYDGYVYYSSKSMNNRTCTMSVTNGNTALFLDSNTHLPIREGNTLYYIDLDNGYALTKLDISTNTKSVITTDKVIFYNVYDNVIFYQAENDTHELVRINTDGSRRYAIFQGDVTSISCTSEYTFFQKFGSDSYYRVPTKGLPIFENFYIENK